MKLKVRTLTPLWTGGITQDSNRMRETGLIGSMRWWYEGLIRGMGGYACDPVEEGRCLYDPRSSAPPEKQLCAACLLFGCTGWRRRFRLLLDGLRWQSLFFVVSQGVYQSSGWWLWGIFGGEQTGGKMTSEGKDPHYTFGVQALWGQDATLQITPLQANAEPIQAQVAYLLDVMSHWGAFGAKPQHGFGQLALEGLNPEWVARGRQSARAAAQRDQRPNHPAYPNMAHFFSQIYTVGENNPYESSGQLVGDPDQFDYTAHFIPCAFDIRYKSESKNPFTGEGQNFGLRPWFRTHWGDQVTHRLLGRSEAKEGEREASRIFVSHLYRTTPDGPFYLKVGGWVPPDLKDNTGKAITAADVADQVEAFINERFEGSELVETFAPEEVL